MATLRRLALSVLFTIATNSYQTTCTVSERTFNKRQHANATDRVESSLLYALQQFPIEIDAVCALKERALGHVVRVKMSGGA